MPFHKKIVLLALASTLTFSNVDATEYGMSPVTFPSSFSVNAIAQIGQTYNAPSAGNGPIRRFEARPSTLQISSFSYQPSSARTRANLQKFVDKTREVNPVGAADMERLFASVDVINQIGIEMSRFGLSKNNAADAFALYWIAAWQAVNLENSDPSISTARTVSAQAAYGLSLSQAFTQASDAQKQEMAEALMVQAALVSASVEVAGADRAQLEAISQAVAQGAAASGLELDQMTLTEDGFIAKTPGDDRN